MSKENGGLAFPQPLIGNAQDMAAYHSEYPGMSLREYAAIKLRVPDSGADWLDDMIRTSNRNELAARAMQGMIALGNCPTEEMIASVSLKVADAMLKQGEVK